MLESVSGFFTSVINDLLNLVCGMICAVLPESPFIYFIDNLAVGNEYLRYINWFLPVAEAIAVLEAWLVCVAFYYLWQLIMSVAKSVSGLASAGGSVPKG